MSAVQARDLEDMSLAELKVIAKDLGIEVHHKSGEAKIIAAIRAFSDGIQEGDIDEQSVEVVEELPAPAPVSEPQEPSPIPEPVPAKQEHRPNAPVKAVAVYPTVDEVKAILVPYIARGLIVEELTDEYWQFRIANKQAAGNMKMPLSQIKLQANILMVPTRRPTEEG